MCVNKDDLTKSYKIKNLSIIKRCNDILSIYYNRIMLLNLEENSYSIKDIINILKTKNDNIRLSFTEYFERWKDEHNNIKGIKNYITAVNAFILFAKHDNILFDEITVNSMRLFENSLEDKARAKTLYPSSILKIFNDAREYYNDYDNNIIRIRHSLSKYRVPQQNTALKRALSISQIRDIFSLPDDNKSVHGYSSRRDLALDCAKLSFCLGGMNSVDLFTCSELNNDSIRYYRQKTKDRRKDNAFMEIEIPGQIKYLVEKYKGTDTVFNFKERFSNYMQFNRAINLGLKEIGKELNIDNLEFYAFRHSLATIAVNDLDIDVYLVAKLLNHVEGSIHITELYIKKDFDKINSANKAVVNYVYMGLKKCLLSFEQQT